MNIFLTIKLIARSWWRNKLFFLISLFSLTVGLGCTNLLITFFIHEYNVEKHNADRSLIYALRQDSPMEEGIKVTYATADATAQIKEKYAEVTDILRVNGMSGNLCKYKDREIKQFLFVGTDSTLTRFFPYTAAEGSLKEVLTTPDKVAVSRAFARRLFGSRNGIGESIEIVQEEGKSKHYTVAAILEERPQSFLHFDLLTGIPGEYWGGPVLLKLQAGASPSALQEKINKDKIPTLVEGTRHYIDPLKELYFHTGADSKQQQLAFFQHSDVLLLYICLISALLVLAIACFNYTNLTLSRTLQQLKMIHIEKLMGAKQKEIRRQLFCDAALTVVLAFLLSLLFINDLLPWFDRLLSARLSFSFFFSWQVLPLLLAFIFLMAVIPGLYISRRLSMLTLSEYRQTYTGRKKQRLIWVLVTIQFLFSTGLVYATTLAQGQMELIKSRAYRYENTIEIGNGTLPLTPFFRELKQVEGIESMSLSMSSVLYCWMRELPIRQADGSIRRHFMVHIPTDTAFFQTLHIRQTAGISPSKALSEYAHPVFINEKFARLRHIDASRHIGHRLKEFDEYSDSLSILAGIFEDFPINSLEEEVGAQQLSIESEKGLDRKGMFIQIKLAPEHRKETLTAIEQAWKKTNDGWEWKYTDMHEVFMQRNQKVITLSHILISYSLIALALTCFGLFGISWYAVRQRTREIAIRKVHGASRLDIVWLLNRSFVWQIVAAYVIAIPVTWWLMQHWLEQFAYRISPVWWHFIVPLAVVATVTVVTVTLHSCRAARGHLSDSLKTE